MDFAGVEAMPGHESATVIGSIGVALLLLAFLLNLMKVMRSDSWLYLGLNFVGAAIACFSSYLIQFMPFVVLEGTWSAVALLGMARKTRAVPTSPNDTGSAA